MKLKEKKESKKKKKKESDKSEKSIETNIRKEKKKGFFSRFSKKKLSGLDEISKKIETKKVKKSGFFARFSKKKLSGLDEISKKIEATGSEEEELRRVGFLEKIGLKKTSLPPEEELRKEAQKVRKKIAKQKKKKLKKKFKYYLNRAGLETKEQIINRKLLIASGLIYVFVSIYLVYKYAAGFNFRLGPFIVWLLKLTPHWFLLLFIILFATWLVFRVYLDLRIHQRKSMIEAVFPDFLQLASANIRAGMPLDRALWFAVRPQFGILAHEIEEVAKETLSGTDLEVALQNFADKYDSAMVGRAMTLLIEGMSSGGEVGELLSKIALNIQQSQILRKEMSADVVSYSMFIGIATILAAPFLFALSGQLLIILKGILSTVAASGGGASGGGGAGFTFTEISLSAEDFNRFAYLALTITAAWSGIIVATIRKGDVKSGISSIPGFIAVTLILYWITSKGLGYLMGGFIG